MSIERYIEKPLHVEAIDLPSLYPYPYEAEDFSEEEQEVLTRFFTNTDRPVFAIKNLPQEIVGAMFSRYSRTPKSVRRVFLDEFWSSEDLGIKNISEHLVDQGEDLNSARKRAGNFYKTVFAEYGDDSVIQMGSVHIAFEYVSQIAAKAIEDQRIGVAYIEKSTRYVDFGERSSNHYLYIEEPRIMNSEFADDYDAWNRGIFAAYNMHLPTTIEHFRRKFPIQEQTFVDPKTGETRAFDQITDADELKKGKKAYERALKAKAFDTIRVFLPTTTVTNLGAHFSGQAAENTVNKMMASDYPEVRMLGLMAYQELMDVSPSFFQNVDHKHGKKGRDYLRRLRQTQEDTVEKWMKEIDEGKRGNKVRLVDWDEDADVKIASQIIFKNQKGHKSKREILDWARKVAKKDRERFPDKQYSETLAEIITSAVPDRSLGLNRRHKLPRAFEHTFVEVEFNTDFGIYRDLQRNRMSTTERQTLSAEEINIPKEFFEEGMETVLEDYLTIFEQTRSLNNRIMASSDLELASAAEYVTILGNRLRFSVRANVRQWVFFSELRTIEGGHPSYRIAMQNAIKQILYVMPFLKPFFANVNWKKDYGLGRLRSELKTQQKLGQLNK